MKMLKTYVKFVKEALLLPGSRGVDAEGGGPDAAQVHGEESDEQGGHRARDGHDARVEGLPRFQLDTQHLCQRTMLRGPVPSHIHGNHKADEWPH